LAFLPEQKKKLVVRLSLGLGCLLVTLDVCCMASCLHASPGNARDGSPERSMLASALMR
jgi:hypothetical protein